LGFSFEIGFKDILRQSLHPIRKFVGIEAQYQVAKAVQGTIHADVRAKFDVMTSKAPN